MTKNCHHTGCKIRASFNHEGETKGLYCSKHKEPGMVCVKAEKCKHSGCIKQPTFNYEGETKRLYCSVHKEAGMVDVKSKKCEHLGCKKIPSFNHEGKTNGLYCSEHKEDDMVNVKSKKCKHKGCIKQPSFNHEGETKGLYCSKHKEPGMVCVKAEKCKHSGCIKQPSFNYEGKTKGLYCSDHKEPGMVCVKAEKCKHSGCIKQPSFNHEGETKGLYCSVHKEDGMVDVIAEKCKHSGCITRPTFNHEGETKGLYCSKHKEYGMVNVKDKKCQHPGCKTICSYGYCGTIKSHCYQHKLEYMITKPKITCIGNYEEECKELATHGKDEPLHCEEHSLPNEFCWLVKKCNNCCRDNELLNKEGLCNFCCDIPFYEESKRMNKVKETTMVRYLKENLILPLNVKELPWDKIVNGDCNMYRPDLPYHCGSFILIIECDENQHKNYPWETCSLNKSLDHAEEKRMYEIMLSYEGLPCIFLRWNPDNFKVKGILCKRYVIEKRLEILKKWVEYCFSLDITKIEGLVQYKKLFYDEYDESDTKFKVVIEEDLL